MHLRLRKQFRQKINLKHRLATGGGNSASPVKRGIAQEAVDDLVRLHLFSISQHPCIRVMAIQATQRAALHKNDKANSGTIYGPETL